MIDRLKTQDDDPNIRGIFGPIFVFATLRYLSRVFKKRIYSRGSKWFAFTYTPAL